LIFIFSIFLFVFVSNFNFVFILSKNHSNWFYWQLCCCVKFSFFKFLKTEKSKNKFSNVYRMISFLNLLKIMIFLFEDFEN
jgi:hypothetical protein